MKNKISPTQNEHVLSESKILVSKTDPKGLITYCNSVFIEMSGFAESELISQQHNILRHPEMPRVIFDLLWQTLQSTREFNGYIKNMTKTGDYYWGFANVTPSFSTKNELLGYYSVHRKPDPEKLDYIKKLYIELFDIEQQSSAKDAIANSKFRMDSILNAKEMGYDEFILSI